ncbi:MAG: FtsW/RodA/SpoVE family cell cycle protein, partial [Acutalibacteraceae bacterium]
PIYWFKFMSTWQKERFYVVFYKDYDPLGMGWQQHQCKTAIANGGWFGQGLFKGEYVQSGSIPKGYNDCIFASIGEELGFVGSVVVILLIGAICFRCLMISRKSRDKMGQMICVGVFAMVAGQALINIGMCLGVMPVIGVTLPLFSSGGTSVITLIMSLGLVLNVYSHRNKRKLTVGG